MFERALIILDEQLKFNICDLETSHKLNVEVFDLDERIKTYISPALKYSAVYWIYHALHSNTINKDNQASIQRLCTTVKVLFWIEVLSLLGHVRKAMVDISKLKLLLSRQSSRPDRELKMEFEDIVLFLSRFGKCISTSTPHLYISALAMAPAQSRIVRHWITFKNRVEVVSHQSQTWASMIQDPPMAMQGQQTGKVCCIAISPDEAYVVSGSTDKAVRIWDAESGQPIGQPMDGHTDSVMCVSVSPNSRYIVSGSRDTTVRIWRAETGQQVGQILDGQCVMNVSFLPNERQVVSHSADTIRIWDVKSGQQVKEWKCSFTCSSLSTNGEHIVVSVGSTTGIWNLQSGQELKSWKTDEGGAKSLSFSSDSRHIVSLSHHGIISTWDNVVSPEPRPSSVKNYNVNLPSTCMKSSPDGQYVISALVDKSIYIWDIQTGQPVGQSMKGHTAKIRALTFSADGKHIISVADDSIRFWNIKSSQEIKHLRSSQAQWLTLIPDSFSSTKNLNLLQHNTYTLCSSVSPDGKHIVVGSEDATIRIWDVKCPQQPAQLLKGHTQQITSVLYFPDCKHIASASEDQTIRIWRAQTGQQVGQLSIHHRSSPTDMSVSPDGRHILSISHLHSKIRLLCVSTLIQPLFPLSALSMNTHFCTHNSLSSTSQPLSSLSFPSNNVPFSCGFSSNTSFLQSGWFQVHGYTILWVPQEYRKRAFTWEILSIPVETDTDRLVLNWNKFVHGDQWHKIYTPIA
ncbi:WD40 repeat-like protein [Pluteus cervinus]|uniref:WD40 repeat-like protein n=1 Tax=Pluteus cervinus TaxID=181527 RepID=A0ACD3A041_9AGAR|nr:WD40 repeat-like protein [Pluteus cervinus]